MSDKDDASDSEATSSLAATRSRRGPGSKRSKREEALAKLKAAKDKKWEYKVEEEMTDNVYDIVDERKYAETVQGRRDEGFIVDDDGEYVEDGREIFDEDEDEQDRSGPRKAAKAKKREEEEKKKKRGNIKNMLLNMKGKKKDEEDKLKDDELLESLLTEVKSKRSSAPRKARAETTPKASPSTRSQMNPFARPSTGIKKPKVEVKEEETEESMDVEDDSALAMMDSEEIKEEEVKEEEVNVSATQNIEEFDEAELSNIMDDDFIEDEASQPPKPVVEETNRGFVEKKKAQKPDLSKVKMEGGSFASKSSEPAGLNAADVKIDQGDLPLVANESGEKVLRMYWLDAHEDPFKHPGTVWLFGKVYVEKAKAHVSCCVTVHNIKRQVFFLKRENKYDAKEGKEMQGEEVTKEDLSSEFNGKVAQRYKIQEHRSKHVEKFYAFEHEDVPNKADYLEVQYSSKFPALPSDLKGETFSRVFGANKSSLEMFLISRKIKGPGWIDIKVPKASKAPISWCKVEAVCEQPNDISVCASSAAPSPPPLTIMALNMKTVINPKTLLNEISMVSCLIQDEFHLDRPAPKQPFKLHFCAVAKSGDHTWPFDFQRALAANASKGGPKVEKMDSERALLGYLLARIGKLDPDIVLGHDITGFDLDVLLHRTVKTKCPQWSRLGRLKRSQEPNFRGRAERQAMTGRLVCDLKISAKELIRCKSYELGALVEKLLAKRVEDRMEVTCEEMSKAYDSSQALLNVANLSLQDAADTLQCIYELNALPLALQITNVAGNVLSRTLLGGRAERNEFLLLHAFNERNYVCPDKQYGKPKKSEEEEGNQENANPKGKGRRKPAYAGGLVLEPKKGFYDKFILLMDFNSLYPSIIQEYNICFTTVSRKKPLGEDGKVDLDHIPELPSSDAEAGILPAEIRKLVESRKAVKKLLKDPNLTHDQRMQYDIRQKALKLTANSMYGCLGFSHSRFFAKPLAALITSRGRDILLHTKALVEKMNLEVIYGDTDSIMINSNSKDYEETFKLGAQIKQEVNKMYRLLELDIDGVYQYMLLLKKKKYAAVTMEMVNGKPVTNQELKGLDIVRRDWSQLAADAGKDILAHIMTDMSADERISYIHEKLESLAADLTSGKISLAHLAITKQLTKNPGDYADKKSLPHVQVAVRLNSKGGKKLRSGDTVEYVICDDGSSLPATQRAYHVDEVKERTELKVDIGYYLAQQLHPVVSRLCDPLEGTDASRIAKCLGEEKIINLTCECGEEVTLDSVVRGMSKDDRVLSLSRCPNAKCDKAPLIQRPAYVQNKLTLAIRKHVKQFYRGYLTCEDPSCLHRTRQMSLRFLNGYPACPGCGTQAMSKDYTDRQLYRQLLYLQQLFDVQKASAKYGKNFNHDLVSVRDGQVNYMLLKQHVDRAMDLNGYSIIDMSKIFSGFSVMRAAKFRKVKSA